MALLLASWLLDIVRIVVLASIPSLGSGFPSPASTGDCFMVDAASGSVYCSTETPEYRVLLISYNCNNFVFGDGLQLSIEVRDWDRSGETKDVPWIRAVARVSEKRKALCFFRQEHLTKVDSVSLIYVEGKAGLKK